MVAGHLLLTLECESSPVLSTDMTGNNRGLFLLISRESLLHNLKMKNAMACHYLIVDSQYRSILDRSQIEVSHRCIMRHETTQRSSHGLNITMIFHRKA